MKRSALFESEQHIAIQDMLKDSINGQIDFLTGRTIESTRAVGDAIQNLLNEHFGNLLREYVKEYSANFARRAMADLAFTDQNGFYHVVDIKTHRLDTSFNMPNLTSVERLARFYEDDLNFFDLLLIAYRVDQLHIRVERVYFVPIEFLAWECLTIGALGWGQIQIANSNRIMIDPSLGRTRWMLSLCDAMMEFYPAEISKIEERIEHFKKVRQRWLSKSE